MTMKTLLILRHGKADNKGKATVETDHPRVLTARGEAEAAAMGRALAARGVQPDAIISSDARRAYQTATLAAAELPQAVPIQLDNAIYNADLETLLGVVRRLPDAQNCIMIVGHNPGFEELAGALTGQPLVLPTGALVCVTFAQGGWSQVAAGAGTLAWLETPATS
jgi:phosphohistidine phosphatase